MTMVSVQIFGERRLHQRKTCAFAITLTDRRRAHRVMLRNLSLGGALIDTPPDRPLRVGQELIITIPYRLRKDSIRIKGRVGRIDNSAMGVVFLKKAGYDR